MNHSFMLYSPSDFSSMDTAQQATMDRYNGIFSPLEISAEAFKAAYDTPDIGPHIEKDYKGLSYLSWPFAYRYLKEHFPAYFVAFEEKTIGEVVFGTPGAYYLRPYLTDGCRRTVALIFPIMDRKHNSIKELDGRAISDNCQRAAVKAIATFTGLGLRLYAGEDHHRVSHYQRQWKAFWPWNHSIDNENDDWCAVGHLRPQTAVAVLLPLCEREKHPQCRENSLENFPLTKR